MYRTEIDPEYFQQENADIARALFAAEYLRPMPGRPEVGFQYSVKGLFGTAHLRITAVRENGLVAVVAPVGFTEPPEMRRQIESLSDLLEDGLGEF